MKIPAKCSKSLCHRRKKVSPEELQFLRQEGERRPRQRAGLICPECVNRAFEKPEEYDLHIPLGELLVVEAAREHSAVADLLHSGNAEMTNLSVDLKLRMGKFHREARPGPFWAIHAPARAFFKRLPPKGSVHRRRRRELPVGIGLDVVPERHCGQFRPPRPAGLPVLSRLGLEPGYRRLIQGDTSEFD